MKILNITICFFLLTVVIAADARPSMLTVTRLIHVVNAENSKNKTKIITVDKYEVHDGDTLSFVDSEIRNRVRLYGIDSPEIDQPFGKESTNYLIKLLDNKPITIVVSGKDRYGRIIGVIYIDTICINEKMVLDGYAWNYPDAKPVSNIIKFHEQIARNNKRGIWSTKDPVAPWVWRSK